MNGLIGKKIGMSSLYDEKGRNVPCTFLEVSPSYVIQVKTIENDGYQSVQLGFDDKKEKNTTKSLKGHFLKSGVSPKKKLVEFSYDGDVNELNLGDSVDLSIFQKGDFVDVVGTSKGKGFQGVVKRHGFSGVGMATHGQHNRLRAPGSIGASSYPSRVFKGMRMAGRTGNERVTVANLEVLQILIEENVLVVKGAVPGPKNAYVLIKK